MDGTCKENAEGEDLEERTCPYHLQGTVERQGVGPEGRDGWSGTWICFYNFEGKTVTKI
jgi:hypothetical protein